MNTEQLENCELTCKLGTKNFHEHKATILESLKRKIEVTRETTSGYIFNFNYSSMMIDELVAFVKIEKECCPFFDFSIQIKQHVIQLELKGPAGTKEFIKDEMQLIWTPFHFHFDYGHLK